MGLDMYLYARRHFYSSDPAPEVLQLLSVPSGYELRSVSAEAAYWRKANHIHKWFVDNVQEGNDDCGEYDVSRAKLTELRNLCQQVKDDHKKAPELLPVQEGFFFGDDDYGQWYFEDIDDTINQIDKALAAFPEIFYFEYSSSW